MKVFVLIITFLYPDGSLGLEHRRVVKCPTSEEIRADLQTLVDVGLIKGGIGKCVSYTLGKELKA